MPKKNLTNNFTHLHLHSTYSFTDGYGTPEQYANKCQELGQTAMGITDHGNISAHYKWYKECKKRNIKPILGCEMYLVESAKQIEEKQREYNHITILAKNNVGYKNLLKLVTKSWCENFYYKPRTTLDELKKHSKGLVVLSGCLSGRVSKMITEGKSDKEIEKEVLSQKDAFDDYFIEVAPLSFPEGKLAIAKLHAISKKLKIPMVATMDCHYVEKKHSKLHEVLLCIQTNTDWKNPKRWKFDQDDFYLKSRKEMEDAFKKHYPKLDFTEALDNTNKVADAVEFEFPKATPMKFPIKESKKESYFRELCLKGLKERGFKGNKEYIARMNYEVDLIIQKKYIDYFLIVIDLVNWAKSKGILVGPARGSAAGSLVCYLTKITEVNPIPFGLIFERFIDINRFDLPDIDVDFEDYRRHEVKEYLSDKYGSNNVGNIATFSVFKGKSSVDDVARVFKLPFDETNKLKSMIIDRSGGDSRAEFTIADTFSSDLFTYPKEMLAKYPELQYTIDLEGQIRHLSEHASGFIVSDTPVTDFCAVYKKGDEHILSIDYADASEIGLIKFDILGIRTLSSLQQMKKTIKEKYDVDIDYYNLPLDDKKTYDGFCRNKLWGIFQFDGQAVNQVCRQIKPRTFEEIGDINALARPGPLNSGSTTMFIERKEGRKKVEYFHKSMKSMTGDTYGIVIYQEQVMKIMREVGNMSWKDTAEIRKLISRSQGVEKFNTFRDKFAIGAKENGLTDKEIDTVWLSMCTFGSWAFNKSHSISYAYIAYWTMYMKVHYPLEFYSVTMSETKDDKKVKNIVKECRREGINILPIDINRSGTSFEIDYKHKGIRIGLSQIKGIGSSIAEQIVSNQPYKTFNSILEKKFKRKFKDKILEYNIKEDSKLIEILKRVGAFSGLKKTIQDDLFGKIESNFDKPKYSDLMKYCPHAVELNLHSKWDKIVERRFDITVTPISELTTETYAGQEVYILGVVYDKNPKNMNEQLASKGLIWTPRVMLDGRTVRDGKTTKDAIENYYTLSEEERKELECPYTFEQPDYMNFTIEDDDDFVITRVGTFFFPEYKKLLLEDLQPSDVILISGKMGSGIRMIFANEIINLTQEFK